MCSFRILSVFLYIFFSLSFIFIFIFFLHTFVYTQLFCPHLFFISTLLCTIITYYLHSHIIPALLMLEELMIISCPVVVYKVFTTSRPAHEHTGTPAHTTNIYYSKLGKQHSYPDKISSLCKSILK